MHAYTCICEKLFTIIDKPNVRTFMLKLIIISIYMYVYFIYNVQDYVRIHDYVYNSNGFQVFVLYRVVGCYNVCVYLLGVFVIENIIEK